MAGNIGDWLSQDPSDPADVATTYDAWAAAYDEDLSAWSYQAPAVVAGIVRSRHPEAGEVLDVGCGTGLVGQALRSQGYAGTLRGLDLSEASLEVARRSGVYAEATQADLQQRLPLADDSTDAVVCVGVMTYLPEVEAVWRELARVTRPGGIVVVTQRSDLWDERGCPGIVDRFDHDGIWIPEEITGPAPYLPEGYGDGEAVDCYYLTARVR